jgi:signal transduction histidine kinase/ActR/RegA family two-component response regulator
MAERLRDRSTVRDLEMRLKTKQGQIRNTLGAMEIIELESQPCVLGIIQDVTERLQLEAQFRQAQKMESVGRLAAGVAHDFNNLLTVIQGYTALLQTPDCSATEVADAVKQVADAARRAANLTHQLLAFSRRQVMRQERINLNDVLHNLAQMLRPLLGEDITVQVDPSPTLPLIGADVGMVEQVVMNLALNARDAMPKGGRLVWRTYLYRLDEEQARKNPEASAGEYVGLSVTDTGCGMDAATLAHIFEPFFTTKEVGKGTGLGLATVFGIVKQHKGWVEVSSQVGRGSTFILYLPAFPGAGAEKPFPRPPETTMVPGKGTILLVEDEPALRRLARRVLEKNGYRILPAASGIEALKEWDKQRYHIDLLITDMVMPGGMNGRDLALRLQTDDTQLKVLYTSGYSAEMVGSGFLLKEGINFLPKPYSPATLTSAVKDCLDTDTTGSGEAP